MERARAAGQKIVRGGRRAEEVGPLFYEPTLIEPTSNDAEVVQNEVFGPVLTIQTFADEAMLAAVAAETEWMEDLLVRLVEASTVLGAEEAGQATMEAAFAECGLDARSVPLDADALRTAAGASPFAWDVSGKRNVVADWLAGGDGGGRSLILNGHVDACRRPPRPCGRTRRSRRYATATGSTAAVPET